MAALWLPVVPAVPVPLPMITFPLDAPDRRLGGLLALLLLVLALSAGLSVATAWPLQADTAQADDVVLPSIRLVHEVVVAVDEVRGLAALHLMLHGASELAEVEARLQAGRLKIERRMALSARRLADDTERSHFQQASASLTAYWATQERLLAASRRTTDDPAAAALARALLAGESQQAFQQVRTDLEAWWAYTEQLADTTARQAASRAGSLVALAVLQVVLAAAALLAAAQAWRSRPARLPAGARQRALDGLAFQAHLVALNAQVAAARSGDGGQPPDATAHEVRQLAEQLGSTAAELKALIAGTGQPLK